MVNHTLPSPYPYYEVIVNRTCAYLIVHAPMPDKSTIREVYRVTDKGFERTLKNPIGRPEHNWQDYLPLKTIQHIYFNILDEYRSNAEVIDIKHAKRLASWEIPS